ncbi:MAG: cyclase family protein [Rhabdochlamydiaceae bacterium]|nr:cyclase family protein [Rhabdochlamydiaceae bacterium]
MLLDHFHVLDLTHPLSANAPTWNGSCGFCLEIKKDYDRIFRVQQIKMHAGVGTHMDAPSHCIPEGACIADIPVHQLIAPACVINVSHKASKDYAISVEDILCYEKTYGTIAKGSLVIGYTGWDLFWNDPVKYRNVDLHGKMHFPSFAKEAAQILVQRDVAGIAIDTLSPDCSEDSFPVHSLILGSGKYIIENISGCAKLPPKGAYAIALPLRAEEGTESPIRIIALVPN